MALTMPIRDWIFGPSEERESFTSQAIAAAVETAELGPAGQHVAIFEACTGLWSRAFAGGTCGELQPDVLARIGRDLVTRGESLWMVQGNAIVAPVSSHDIEGAFEPASWRYRVDLPGPSSTNTRRVQAANILHLRINMDPSTPWRGRSPWSLIRDSALLLQGLERQLRNEAAGPSGFILPVPKPTTELSTDVSSLGGRVVLGESTSADNWGGGGRGSPTGEWRVTRLGLSPPDGTVELRTQAEASIAAAAGVPPSLLSAKAAEAAGREAWRMFVLGTIAAIAASLAPEIAAKLGGSGAITFEALRASDIQGRARAFAALTGGGMTTAQASAVVGFDTA